MILPDQDVPLTLTAAQLNVVFACLSKAPVPYEAVAPVIDALRRQTLAHDPQAFDQPRINGLDAPPSSPADQWRTIQKSD